jgi:hypothetical protein
MPTKKGSKGSEPALADERSAPKPRDEGWDARLRSVGDANFVHVAWSGKDDPVWPLPKK